jgi:hypothetical protein
MCFLDSAFSCTDVRYLLKEVGALRHRPLDCNLDAIAHRLRNWQLIERLDANCPRG